MKLPLTQAQALTAFRKSPMAFDIRGILEQELAAARDRYENQPASEENRALVIEARTVLNTLFNEPIEVAQ